MTKVETTKYLQMSSVQPRKKPSIVLEVIRHKQ